ncbi:XRE family transcriptional regulator [Streptomyces sp. NBC_00377]|uniref:helix-turn-helix domain-containing protein n=1 Tax=unclassified Streptomyces TaxID=2593676 RepID=UPI002E1B0FA1|nr:MULTISPECIES: DUF2690 domain-containing protein [unclassified Streptomyces]
MPRWRTFPDELDPQVREFAEQLRRVVDRSGLSVAAVADRTGYSRTSWERYLDGRLLAPKGAVVALAEVTGTPPVHLTTMWELAERAWSRSEMRQDRTMEAVRIAQARAALGEFGPPPEVRADGADRDAGTPDGTGPAGGGARGAGPRRTTLFLAGAVGVVVVAVGAFLLSDGGDPERTAGATAPSSSASAGPSTVLPSGVLCGGAGCTGRDAEEMGCSGDLATTARSATVGTTLVEVRYSRTCGAVWGRITRAGQGDEVRLTAGSARQTGAITVAGDTIAYTPMVAVRSAADAAAATACAVLASGQQGCTP